MELGRQIELGMSMGKGFMYNDIYKSFRPKKRKFIERLWEDLYDNDIVKREIYFSISFRLTSLRIHELRKAN